MPAPARRRRRAAPATRSFAVFRTNLSRSRAFIRLFDGPGGRAPGQPSNDEKELLRGAVVFAVGALDAYLHELILEVVPEHGGDRNELTDALRAIAREDPALSLRVALAPDAAARTREFRSALDMWLAAKSFQGAAAVTRALSYLGCSMPWTAFDAATGANTADRLEHFTRMRHGIVHRGERPFIRRAQASECCELVSAIASTIEAAVSSKYLAT